MAESIVTLAPDYTTVTTARAFWQGIHDNLIAVGAVDSGDTGQTTISGASLPGAINTVSVKRCYKFGDALTPYYVLLEMGSGAVATTPAFWLTVGTTTDGACGISGNTYARTQHVLTAGSATPLRCQFTGSTTRFGMALCLNNVTGNVFIFGVARLLDDTLAVMDKAVHVLVADPSQGVFHSRAVGKLNGSLGNGSLQSIPTHGLPRVGPFSKPGQFNAAAIIPVISGDQQPALDWALALSGEIQDFAKVPFVVGGVTYNFMSCGTLSAPGSTPAGRSDAILLQRCD